MVDQGEIIQLKRQTARIVWTQIKFIDPQENREAYSRICIGLGSGVQCLITFDYWADDVGRLLPVWDTGYGIVSFRVVYPRSSNRVRIP